MAATRHQGVAVSARIVEGHHHLQRRMAKVTADPDCFLRCNGGENGHIKSLPKTVARVGYQDDYNVMGEVSAVGECWDSLGRDLAADGHKLKRAKCSGWAPAWGDTPTKLLPDAQKKIFDRVPRETGGMIMLGAACQAELKTSKGPPDLVTEEARKRAKAADR